MKLAPRLPIACKALRELGLKSVGLFALYQFGLQSGHYHRQLTASLSRLKDLNQGSNLTLHLCLPNLPDRDAIFDLLDDQVVQLYTQADEIVDGKVRLFGSQPVPLILTLPGPLFDWTYYAGGNDRIDGQDIKLIWEPGRFGWACTLAMAYHLSGDPRYSEAFWDYTDKFFSSNPAYMGPHWSSAQEAAIRLIALAFSLQVFTQSGQATPEQLESIAKAIAIHAERIPPTLVYARSQNNNHLITEALGLYTASALLPEHPLAAKWHRLGWAWLQSAIRTQIDPDGTYIQHSTNYHRLMLQAALWAFAVHDHSFDNEPIPPEIASRLEAATHWLWKLIDPETGRVPNLGHNDGAYILPLSIYPYHDYRPVIQAAAQRFLNINLTPKAGWSDMSQWLGASPNPTLKDVRLDYWHDRANLKTLTNQSPYILQNPKNGSWATICVARFHSRPAHADQLHLDLWWRGTNLAQDPGTYLYNSAPPWENSLTSALVHNTVTVDGQEFMLRASRFLYLDWAQGKVIKSETDPDRIISITAAHNGYRNLGIIHDRKLIIENNGDWEIIDRVTGSPLRIHTIRLHWLLPDWEFEIQEATETTDYPRYRIRIRSPYGWVSLNIDQVSPIDKSQASQIAKLQVVRASKLIYGSGEVYPIYGWTSPTYGDKIPALACILELSQSLPIELKSVWTLPNET